MAILTELSLFTGVINIDVSSRGVESEVQDYCQTIEEEALIKLLGESLYTEYIGNTTDQKWVDLIEGTNENFTFDGKTRKYTGLKDKICYLIYFRYIQDQYASNTPFGDVAPSPSNGTYQMNYPRMCRAYNKYVDAFNMAVDYINYSNADVPNTYENFTTQKIGYINSFGI